MTDDGSTAPLLHVSGLTKRYAGVAALTDAAFTVGRGEAHALVGENGAGKSTLVRLVTGATQRDAGEVVFEGAPVAFGAPLEAQRGGIAAIYQELNLVPFASIAENVFLGRLPRRFGLVDWRRLNAEAEAMMRRLNVAVDVRRPLASVSTSVQQMTALGRALAMDCRLLFMDEPTSSLDEREVETLFEVVRGLKATGVSVVFITHRLDEIFAICDRITVMRDGRTVRTAAVAEMDKLALVAAMLGRAAEDVRRFGATALAHRDRPLGAPWLEARGLADAHRLRGVDLAVSAQGVIGLGGLLGSGRTETARALFGDNPEARGEIAIDGAPAKIARPRDAIARGLGFCTENRKTEGIVPMMSVRDNLTLALAPRLSRAGILDGAAQRKVAETFAKRLGVKAASLDQPIRELSGGNQQKVLLARWLCLGPRLLILDEPTRGIDVGAKAEIQRLIREMSDAGLAVLMISSEIEELVEGCDRVVVLRDGRVAARLEGAGLTEGALMAAMAEGATDAGA